MPWKQAVDEFDEKFDKDLATAARQDARTSSVDGVPARREVPEVRLADW